MPYVGKEPVRGQNRELDDISGSFNGGNTAFTMQVGGSNTAAASANQVFISLGGVMQNPGTDFTVASSTITFTTPPANGLDFWGLIQGDAVDIQEPADGSVTSSKIASGNLTLPSDLTIPDKIVHDGDTNTAIRFPAADTITAETGGSERLRINSDGDIWQGGTTSSTARFAIQGASANTSATHADTNGVSLILSNTDTTNNNWQGIEFSDRTDSGDFITGILSQCTNHASNYGDLTFWTNGSSGRAERARVTSDGNFHLTGNLVMAAAGKGIDFSDTGDHSGATSELLDDYEEGTWTPSGTNLPTASNVYGKYMKVGRIVHAWWQMEFASDGSNAHARIDNLPYTSESAGPYAGGTAWDYRTNSTVNVHVSGGTTILYFYTDVGNNCNGDDSRIQGKQFRACTTYRAA